MSDRYAIQVRWDGRIQRYVARCRQLPTLIIYGETLAAVQENMQAAINAQERGK